MKKKYFISSSSNIFPNTSYWNNLKETSILEFSNYGDIKDSILSNNYDQSIFLIIFLSDLQIFNNLEKKNKFFLPIFNLLEKRLKNSKYPTFFFFSKYNFEYNILDRINKNFFKIEKNINVFNSYLRRLQNKYSNFYLLDIDSYFSFFGYSNCFDPRNWYLAKARLSAFGIEQLVNLIKICTDKLNSPTKKVLILDCDNTLWGGVVGEDGFKKLIINNESGVGLSFYDFQRIVKKIKNQGVLLALCSKNNENDVWEVFDKNTNMFLSKNDFSIAKINWNEKYKNILEISDDLGLALDSFVFWDDNQIEREKVKKFLPEVKVIDAKDDVSFWANQLNQDLNLFKLNILKEDKNKQAQYIQRKKFINDKKNFKDEIEYLSKINLRAKVEEISDHNILRASQLTQKTNQFNFTSKRYTVEDIIKLNQSSDKIIKVISLKDTYGDHGIVGLYILNIEKNKKAVVDTFLMSCRVIGRYLEDWMLKKIIDHAKKNNVKNLYIPFSLTLKNFICKNFFVRNNLIQKNINKFDFNQKEMEFNLNLNNKINIKLAKIYEKKNK